MTKTIQMNNAIGKFDLDQNITLARAPNGGWVVSNFNYDHRTRDEVIGAYGSAEEMIAALTAALCLDEPADAADLFEVNGLSAQKGFCRDRLEKLGKDLSEKISLKRYEAASTAAKK